MNADSTCPTSTFAGFPPGRRLNCPECDYLLKGLPTEGACPECGLRYDADTKVFIASGKDAEPGFFSAVLGELFCYAFLISIALWFVDIWVFAAGCLITIAFFAAAMFFDWDKLTAPDVIIVGPNELRFIAAPAEHFKARWVDVDEIIYRNPWFGEKTLILRQKDGTRHTLQFPGKDQDRNAAIVDAIRRRSGSSSSRPAN